MNGDTDSEVYYRYLLAQIVVFRGQRAELPPAASHEMALFTGACR